MAIKSYSLAMVAVPLPRQSPQLPPCSLRCGTAGSEAIALTTDTSALTAIGNDYGYDCVFDRQVEALANTGDVAIGISTGGSSANVASALKLAKDLDCKTIGFSGRGGGEMNELCDINIVVPAQDTARIQEMHIVIGHTICHLIDLAFSEAK